MATDTSTQFRQMVDALYASPFVLILGAGVNGALSPQWAQILAHLQSAAYEEIKGRIDPRTPGNSDQHLAAHIDCTNRKHFSEFCNTYCYEAQAQLYRLLLGNSFSSQLKHVIYRGFNYKELVDYIDAPGRYPHLTPKYGILRDLTLITQHSSVMAVLTLNYDTFLEMSINALKHRSRVPYSVPGRLYQSVPPSPYFPIFHLHGILPYPSPELLQDSQNIVLSQNEYLSLFDNNASDANSSAIHFFTHYPCVFIGLSMKDWNIIRYLKYSKENGRSFQHYCIMKSERYGDRLKATLLNAYGVSVVFSPRVENEDHDYQHLRNLIAEFRSAMIKKRGVL